MSHSSLAGGITSTSSNRSSSASNVLVSLLNFAGAERVHIGHIEEENYDAEKIAHGLHYASISILSVLVGEVIDCRVKGHLFIKLPAHSVSPKRTVRENRVDRRCTELRER